jgi:hypothetical protein
MIAIKGKEYKAKLKWSEITIALAEKLADIELPKKLETVLKALIDDNVAEYDKAQDSISYDDLVKEFPIYYGKVIALMTEIDVENLQWEERTDIFDNYFREMIIELKLLSPHTEKIEEKFFEFKGEKFYFPESLRLQERFIPAYKERAVTFVEGTQQTQAIQKLKDQGIGGLSMIIAVYCRKKDEKYDEDIVAKRVDEFKELTMDIGWNVFFCLFKLLALQPKIIEESFKGATERKKMTNMSKVD